MVGADTTFSELRSAGPVTAVSQGTGEIAVDVPSLSSMLQEIGASNRYGPGV